MKRTPSIGVDADGWRADTVQHASSLGEYTVLVVEDNPNVLEATSYLIEAAFGCNVVGASSCAEALALIDGGSRVDLLFSEVVLPGKDELTLARLARERIPNVPVVLATEWTDEIDAILDRGYVPLLKPYSVQRLEVVFAGSLCKSLGESASNEHGHEAVPVIPSPIAGGGKAWHVTRT
jgi:CheY-like chemotaxis protein